jgi:hypothetical protein
VRGDLQYYTKDQRGNEVPLNPEQACAYKGDVYYRHANSYGHSTRFGHDTKDPDNKVRPLGGAVGSFAHPGAMASFMSGNRIHPTDWPL